MAKFIFSLGDANYHLLAAEARARDITIQELVRAVIIPDWMRLNLEDKALKDAATLLTPSTGFSNQRTVLPPSNPIGRLKA